MRAEAGLGGVPAGPVPIAEQRVQPAVGLTALGKIVDQFDVAIGFAQRIDAASFVQSSAAA